VHNRHANSEASQPKPSGRSVATRSHTKKRKGTQKGPEWPTAKAPTSSTSRPRLARRPPPTVPEPPSLLQPILIHARARTQGWSAPICEMWRSCVSRGLRKAQAAASASRLFSTSSVSPRLHRSTSPASIRRGPVSPSLLFRIFLCFLICDRDSDGFVVVYVRSFFFKKKS
jgi:hypothetical protein